MAFDTGDVIIYDGTPGHVAMIYEPAAGRNPARVIHAQFKGNFHIESAVTEKSGTMHYMVDNNANIYTPPWSKCADPDGKKRELRRIAAGIAEHATYGVYRAVRLWAGSSIYGPKAHERLQKYRDRANRNFQDAKGNAKFVSTVTCAEAVILCYQMAFADGTEPFFIRLDGAHSMPKTLGTWLKSNWGDPRRSE